METKKTTIAHISEPTASKNPGTSYVFVRLDSGERACYFYKGILDIKTGQNIEYTLDGEPGRLRLKLSSDKPKWTGGNNYQPKIDNKVEALKMAVSAFNSGKITEERIKPMAKYLLTILSE